MKGVHNVRYEVRYEYFLHNEVHNELHNVSVCSTDTVGSHMSPFVKLLIRFTRTV